MHAFDSVNSSDNEPETVDERSLNELVRRRRELSWAIHPMWIKYTKGIPEKANSSDIKSEFEFFHTKEKRTIEDDEVENLYASDEEKSDSDSYDFLFQEMNAFRIR